MSTQSTQSTQTKLERLESPGAVAVIPAMPDGAQFRLSGAHVQIKLGGSYTGTAAGFYRLDQIARTQIKLAVLEMIKAGLGQESYRPGSEGLHYVPLSVVPRGEGSPIVDLLLPTLETVIMTVVVDPTVTLKSEEAKGWGKGHDQATEGDGDEGDDDDDDSDDSDDE